jgi:hypothetical protein
VVENAAHKKSVFNDEPYRIKYASKIDDLILRYIEYIEWYEIRPDKIKHLEFIAEHLTSDEEQKKMLDKLHYYTAFPTQLPREPLSMKLLKKRARKHIERLRNLDANDVKLAFDFGRRLIEKQTKKMAEKILTKR